MKRLQQVPKMQMMVYDKRYYNRMQIQKKITLLTPRENAANDPTGTMIGFVDIKS